MATSIWFWIIFNLAVLVMLALDLGVFHRKAHVVRPREAALWSALWVALALGFAGWVYLSAGRTPALEFVTGWLIEKSLSIDNIFVMAVIFAHLAVPERHQHRVLFWGVLGALVLRGAFIAGGALLLARFEWVIYVFGALLLVTGVRMARKEPVHSDPGERAILRWTRQLVPVTDGYRGGRFFVREAGRWAATPLFLALVLVEATDVLFAVDSIPAIFAVTRDPFLVYTSNVFAILGLRSLYFLVAGMVTRFHLLRYALAFILVFVGAKMIAAPWVHVPAGVSLGVIAAALLAAVGLSWARDARGQRRSMASRMSSRISK